MKFSITLVPQDYVNARRLSFRPRKSIWILFCLLVAILSFVIVWGLVESVRTGVWREGLGWVIFLPAYLAVLYFWAIPRGARRVFKQQKTLHEPVDFTFDEHGMRAENLRGYQQMNWSDFFKWKANDKVVLLYHSSAIFNMIPRRAFASDADYQQFQSLVEKHLGKQKP